MTVGAVVTMRPDLIQVCGPREEIWKPVRSALGLPAAAASLKSCQTVLLCLPSFP
jgi:hypothetical protein